MKLSIIMPSFNSASKIGRAIKSFVSQKTEDTEIVIIDGGSKDNTKQVVESFGDQIGFFLSEPDKGYGDALNKAISHAKGEYVMMLAADDQILPGALSVALRSLKKDTDVWCGMIVEEMSYGYRFNISDPDLEKLRHECILRHPATLFRRSLFEQYGGYDINYKCAADREIFLRFYTNGAKFQIERIPMVLFEMNGMSIADPTEKAIPEDYRLSIQYGLSEEEAERDKQAAIARVRKTDSQVPIKNLLGRIGLLSFIYKLAGKPDGCLTKKAIKDLKIDQMNID